MGKLVEIPGNIQNFLSLLLRSSIDLGYTDESILHFAGTKLENCPVTLFHLCSKGFENSV